MSENSHLLIHEAPLLVLPTLAKHIGLNEAIVLQQIQFWSQTSAGVIQDGRKWIYNSVREWQQQFPFWSEDTIQRAIKRLRSMGILEVESFAKNPFDHTNYYSINYDNLRNLITASCGNPSRQDAAISTETTTETNLSLTRKRNNNAREGSSLETLSYTSTPPEPKKPTKAKDLSTFKETFDRIWQKYPAKHHGEDAARRTLQSLGVRVWQTLIENIEPWLDYWQVKAERGETEFIPSLPNFARRGMYKVPPPALGPKQSYKPRLGDSGANEGTSGTSPTPTRYRTLELRGATEVSDPFAED